jgi:hypothetical protein
LVFEIGRPLAGIVTACRAFNFDHIRPQVAETLSGQGAGDNPGKVNHAEAGKRANGGALGHIILGWL